LETLGIERHARAYPGRLSGGERQRVAIARALVNRPALVLGDEPTGAVDSQTSDELVGLMRRLNREEGVTFVVVTHDPELAAQTDRIVRLADGRVVSDDRTDLAASA
jgi:putative ABC transport system ATP-binding protein